MLLIIFPTPIPPSFLPPSDLKTSHSHSPFATAPISPHDIADDDDDDIEDWKPSLAETTPRTPSGSARSVRENNNGSSSPAVTIPIVARNPISIRRPSSTTPPLHSSTGTSPVQQKSPIATNLNLNFNKPPSSLSRNSSTGDLLRPQRLTLGSTMAKNQRFIESALPILAGNVLVSPRSVVALTVAGDSYAGMIDTSIVDDDGHLAAGGDGLDHNDAVGFDSDAEAKEEEAAAKEAERTRRFHDSVLLASVPDGILNGILDPRLAQLIPIANLDAFVIAHSPAQSRSVSCAREGRGGESGGASVAVPAVTHTNDSDALSDDISGETMVVPTSVTAASIPRDLAVELLARLDTQLSLSTLSGGKRQTVVVERFRRPEDAYSSETEGSKASAASLHILHPRSGSSCAGGVGGTAAHLHHRVGGTSAGSSSTNNSTPRVTASSTRPQFPPGDLNTVLSLAAASTLSSSSSQTAAGGGGASASGTRVSAAAPSAPFLSALGLKHRVDPLPAGTRALDPPKTGEGFWPDRMFVPKTFGVKEGDADWGGARDRLNDLRDKQVRRKRDEGVDAAYVP